MKFTTGMLVATPGALEAMEANNIQAGDLISRHVNGDWGDLCDEDKEQNDMALMVYGDRLLSSYVVAPGTKIWIITEADRSSTTLLLPEEY